jgi:transposase/transposase-like protein
MIHSETRLKAIIHYENFPGSIRFISRLYSVSRSSLSRWVRKQSADEKCLPKRKRTRVTKYSPVVPYLVNLVTENPYMTCTDIRRALYLKHGVSPSSTSVYRSLRQSNITHKRAQLTRLESSLKDHPLYHQQAPYENVIAIDECHFNASDYVRYGWAPKRERLSKRKNDRPQRLSLLLAVSKRGVVASQIVRGRVDSSVFIDFLSKLPSGTNLMLDNASIHRSKLVKTFCLDKKMTLNYIPPYCPWYNPVEYAFSNIKRVFRRQRLISDDFDRDVHYAVTQLPCLQQSFRHAEKLWAKDAALFGLA